MAVAAAIISAALLVLLLEITVRNELAEEASNNSLSVLPMPPASSTEVQPVDLAALMGAPSADDAETLVQSLVASSGNQSLYHVRAGGFGERTPLRVRCASVNGLDAHPNDTRAGNMPKKPSAEPRSTSSASCPIWAHV